MCQNCGEMSSPPPSMPLMRQSSRAARPHVLRLVTIERRPDTQHAHRCLHTSTHGLLLIPPLLPPLSHNGYPGGAQSEPKVSPK